jgi:hypothetical protein
MTNPIMPRWWREAAEGAQPKVIGGKKRGKRLYFCAGRGIHSLM